MSTIAVFGVLAGGGAYAASNIGPNDIAENAVRSKHVKEGEVRTPDLDDGAVTRGKLAKGALSVPVTEVTPYPLVHDNCAPGLGRTGEFCGRGSNPDVETIRAWRNHGEGYAPAAFLKDATGRVHLEGSVEVSARETLEVTIFILPADLRPDHTHVFPVHDASAGDQYVTVRADGRVMSSDLGTAHLSLDGISFRAG
jgi:hypothetical protein